MIAVLLIRAHLFIAVSKVPSNHLPRRCPLFVRVKVLKINSSEFTSDIGCSVTLEEFHLTENWTMLCYDLSGNSYKWRHLLWEGGEALYLDLREVYNLGWEKVSPDVINDIGSV